MRGITVELRSARLPQFADEVACLVCGQGNLPNTEYCRGCSAPMVLAHQSHGQTTAPLVFATLGKSGAGKTVYLGMLLDMLSRQSQRMQLTARGGFSITLQQNTLTALGRREFPAKTPNEPDRWNWVHGQLHRDDEVDTADVVLPDVAGESLTAEIDHPRSYEALHGLLHRSDGLLVLIDGARLQSASLAEDYFTMKLLSHLHEIHARRKPASAIPVALVISKADQCESAFDDPAGYARTHAPGVWRICQKRFPRHGFFAASVAGACVVRPLVSGGEHVVPLRIEPRGIVEPFQWLVDNVGT